MQNGIKKEGRGFYSVWVNGDMVDTASNPEKAQAKFEKLSERAARWASTPLVNAELEYLRCERNGMAVA